jgi:phosphodiesterase/alkaline phosphatase D-like protein
MALAAWSMSIIMARWKWATAPATSFRRWNVSRRRAVAEAQPSAKLMVGPDCGARCAVRDTGAAAPARYHSTVTMFDETDPVATRRTGGLREAHAEGALLAYVEGGNWPSGGGIGDNGWRRSSGACRRAMIEENWAVTPVRPEAPSPLSDRWCRSLR